MTRDPGTCSNHLAVYLCGMACFCGVAVSVGTERFSPSRIKTDTAERIRAARKTDTGEGEPAQLCQKSAEFFDFREVVLIQKTDLIKR